MPKLKTHKGTSSRMKVTGTGKVMRRKGGSGHLMSSKNGKRCRALRKDKAVFHTIANKARILIGK